MPHILAGIFASIWEDVEGIWLDHDLSEAMQNEHPEWSASEAEYRYDQLGVLVRCAQVNSQWYYEAVRILWRQWTDTFSLCLHAACEKLEPARRQFYASFLYRACLFILEDDHQIDAAKDCLGDIIFPKLEHLTICVPGHGWGDNVEIPIIRAPRMIFLEIDPRFERNPDTYGVDQSEWERLFKLIPVSYPA